MPLYKQLVETGQLLIEIGRDAFARVARVAAGRDQCAVPTFHGPHPCRHQYERLVSGDAAKVLPKTRIIAVIPSSKCEHGRGSPLVRKRGPFVSACL